MILAIDTSAGQCAVALVGHDCKVVKSERMSRGHAEALMPMVGEVTGGDYSRVTRIAVCTGPGSFTGLRVGISAARGLALGLGVPCIGVSRLEAIGFKRTGQVALKGRGTTLFIQEFEDGKALSDPRIETQLPDGTVFGDGSSTGREEDGLPDPLILAEIAATREAGAPPAPLYLRDAAADPPREGPPRMLD
ncbi:MAG: tRNA (adenosine(37)-N6)-threonylcarbamoyltransferase complex dimerization subunit type 1 TsaB [Pseudomonadota bacterium]